jgi:hypothetical protein
MSSWKLSKIERSRKGEKYREEMKKMEKEERRGKTEKRR